MKKLLFPLFFFVAINSLLAQGEKYAIVFSRLPSVTGVEKLIARNNLGIVRKGLVLQQFKETNILVDTTGYTKESFFRQLESVTNRVLKGDFVFLYFDLPLDIEPGPDAELKLVLDIKRPAEFVRASELQNALDKVSRKINEPALFFALFDADSPSADSLRNFKKFSLTSGINTNYVFSTSPGEKRYIGNYASVFAGAVVTAMTQISDYNTSYRGLFNNIKNAVLLATTKQNPQFAGAGINMLLFNGKYIRYLPHFNITGKNSATEVIINAGTKTNLLTGTKVRFYKSFSDTTGQTYMEGKVIELSDNRATVKLDQPLFDAPDKIWAYIYEIPVGDRNFSISLNDSYGGGSKNSKLFQQVMTALKTKSYLYSNFVRKGGDLQISNITKLNGDSLELTLVNPNSGQISAIIKVENSNELQPMVDFCEQLAKYEYLSQLSNSISGLEVEIDMTDKQENALKEKENGFNILYDGDEVVLTIKNSNKQRLYYALIDLTQDKNFAILGSEGDDPADYSINPETTQKIPIGITPPFGKERVKVLTSLYPIDLSLFRPANYYSRGQIVKFQDINIQDCDFEARSRLYDRKARAGERIIIVPEISSRQTVAGKVFTVKNPSSDRIYFNLLKQKTDGTYQVIFPNLITPEANCFVECENCTTKKEFTFLDKINDYDQLITVYADRPFNLSKLALPDKPINDLLVEIVRNGRIAGSPLNKIGMVQELYIPEKTTVSRDAENVLIKLVTPKVSVERGAIVSAMAESYDINGFALCKDNKPVKTLKINGQPVKYDQELKFFENTIRLSDGINKVVIEATDEAGFTATRILQLELKNKTVVAAGKGKNYFLGIGIDTYKTWPVLNNAKNDVVVFSKLLETKFGFDSINLLLDGAATRTGIINQIRRFLKIAGPNDNIIIYLSGHGNEDQLADGDYYFIPQEADADDVASAVKSTDIMDNFKKIKAKRCLLIVDACYSGMITNSVNPTNQPITSSDDNLSPENANCKWIITSGRATKVLDGDPGKNSPFASVLINYLREHDDLPSLKMSKLIEFLKDKVNALNKLQEPLGIPIEGRGEWIFTLPERGKK
ncbi:MAG: caspase family protein [Bacteroidota bacterium]|nr:caspase family protein [Bacteroidota bacterium]